MIAYHASVFEEVAKSQFTVQGSCFQTSRPPVRAFSKPKTRRWDKFWLLTLETGVVWYAPGPGVVTRSIAAIFFLSGKRFAWFGIRFQLT